MLCAYTHVVLFKYIIRTIFLIYNNTKKTNIRNFGKKK